MGRLENIGANGTSSGVQVVTNRNPGRHVLGGGSNQKSKPRRGQGANRNGNPSNQNRQQTNLQTNYQNTKNMGPGFKQTYLPGSQYQNIKCGAGERIGCSVEPVRTVGKNNVNQGGNNANIQKNNRNNQNGQNRGTNNMKTNRQQPNRQQANNQPNNQSNQNGRWNNRNNNRQQTHQKTNAQRNSQNAQNQRTKNTQNRPQSGSGFVQTYEPGSQYQNFKCGTRGCLGGQVRTA